MRQSQYQAFNGCKGKHSFQVIESLFSCRHSGIIGERLQNISRTGKGHLRSWTSKEDLLRNSPDSNLTSPKANTCRSFTQSFTPSLSRLVHWTLQTLQTLQTLHWTKLRETLRVASRLPPSFQRYTGCPSALFPTCSQDSKDNFAFQRGRESSEVCLVMAFFFKSLH